MRQGRLFSLCGAAALLSLLVVGASCAGKNMPGGMDRAWWDDRDSQPEARYAGIERSSFYLPMRDGVRLAVDVYLPANRGADDKLPALLMQTRYFRRFEFHWPFKNMGRSPELERVVEHGYALVRIDARGTGASFGTRSCPWSKDEIADGAEVVDWIVAQPWSNGNVGAAGGSYEGTAAEFLLVNRHEAVKAVVPMFSLFDVYEDIAFPGGVHLAWFTRTWQRGNMALDANRLKDAAWYAPLFTSGVPPVDDDPDGLLLREAVAGHAANYHVHDEASQITYRDDVSAGGISVDNFSPHAYLDDIRGSGAAIYSYSGWYDGAYALSAIKRYMSLDGDRHRLILGPWDHGGDHHIHPLGKTSGTAFDHVGEVLRFLDHHLLETDTGIHDEPPVHYYTMGENRWKTADTWPPPGASPRTLFVSDDRSLATAPPADNGQDEYEVDFDAGLGNDSQYHALAEGTKVGYPNRAKADGKLLVYETAPLDADAEVTGHPLVTLFVSSTAADGAFFVYLEDVAPDGTVGLVTGGALRALHRKLSDEEPPYESPAVYRTYLRKDGMPLVPGEIAELTFNLLPTSYRFREGHRIRIAIAGADKDNFALVPGDPPTIRVHRGPSHPSRIVLPVMEME